MSRKVKIIALVVVVTLLLAALVGWPQLQRVLYVGTGYSAKRLCSEVFVAGRKPAGVERVDLGFMPVPLTMEVDRKKKIATVTAPLGLVSQVAAYREGLGCALTYGSSVEEVQAMGFAPGEHEKLPADKPWPQGSAPIGELPEGIDEAKLAAAIKAGFAEPDPEHPRRTRAVAVAYKGQLVAESYAEGFDRDRPLLGWSMTKSLTNALIGALVLRGELDIKKPAPLKAWSDDPARASITTDTLLRMSSGLGFDEDYGAFGDATKMLFVSPSTAGFAAQASMAHSPGERWYYSSGDTNLLMQILREKIGDDARYHRFPQEAIFGPIGARSAVLETDPGGTFVGSSFLYMTARDWARFGQLYLQDGVWAGERLLPAGWVEYSCRPTKGAPKGGYGAQWWLNAGEPVGSSDREWPDVPPDACAARGFEAQRVIVIPSREVVIVRLGLTRERGAFDTNAFVAGILAALPKN